MVESPQILKCTIFKFVFLGTFLRHPPDPETGSLELCGGGGGQWAQICKKEYKNENVPLFVKKKKTRQTPPPSVEKREKHKLRRRNNKPFVLFSIPLSNVVEH